MAYIYYRVWCLLLYIGGRSISIWCHFVNFRFGATNLHKALVKVPPCISDVHCNRLTNKVVEKVFPYRVEVHQN